MREKIARALMVKRGGKCLVTDWAREEEQNPNVHRALTDADAVLDALMEPTEGMIAHAEALSDFVLPEGFDNSSKGRRAEFRGAFVSAIQAAKEGK